MSNSSVPPMMWRFTAIDYPEVEVMFCRDCDSRLSEREKSINDSWLNEHTSFMTIKDHPECHLGPAMYGGMWAMRKIANFNMTSRIESWLNTTTPATQQIWGADQNFLAEHIYPIAQKSLSYYDDYNVNQSATCQKITHPRKNWHFIGEIFDENEQRDFQWRSLRGYQLRKYGWPGYIFSKVLNLFQKEWPK